MKAVQGFSHLYQRNHTFYFRFVLRKYRTKFQIMFSLRTSVLTEAIQQWQILNDELKALKRLVVRYQIHETEEINRLVNGFKVSMQKKLQMHHIDPMIAALEKTYNTQSHTYKVIGSDDPYGTEFPESFLNAYQAMLKADTKDLGLLSLHEFFEGLNTDEKTKFGRFFTGIMLSEVKSDYTLDDPCIEDRARRLLEEKNISFDETSLEFKVLLSKLESSTKLQHDLINSVNSGNAIKERELTQLLGRGSELVDERSESHAPLFSEVYAEFIDHKVNKENLADKIQQDYARRIAVWNILSEDKAIDQYTPQDIGRFIDRCFELPRMNLKPYNKMTWAERLEVDVPDEDLATPKSVSHYYKWLQGIFAYAMRDTVGYIQTTPCTIKRSFKANIRGAFDNQELKQFLKTADTEEQAWKKWIIYLVIYTGARRGELVQLRKENVKVDEKTGRHYLLITDIHESQKLKSENAKRKIPLHQNLIEAGFLDYVGRAEERVFEELASSEAVTRWFARQMVKVGVSTENELGHVRSYHSFRHSFISTVRNNGVPVNLVQQVVGHELSKSGITDNYTHKTTELEKLLCVVDAFEV